MEEHFVFFLFFWKRRALEVGAVPLPRGATEGEEVWICREQMPVTHRAATSRGIWLEQDSRLSSNKAMP